MRIKTILFFTFLLLFKTNSFALNVDSIKLKLVDYQQKDKLYNWLNELLKIESFYYSNADIIKAESTLDSIILQVWRKPNTELENDLFFKLYWYKADYLKGNGHIVKAKNHFEKSLNYYANSSKIHQEDLLIIYPKLGNSYTILGDNDKAILTHQKMIEVANSLDSNKSKNDYLTTAYTNLAIVYETQDKISLAINIIEKATKLSNVSDYELGKAFSNYGNFLFRNNQFDKAQKQLKKAIKILKNVENFDLYYFGGMYKTMALISIEQNNILDANYFFDLAIENYKNSREVRNREIAKTYLEKSIITNDKSNFLNIALQYLIPHKETFPSNYFPDKIDLYAENTLADIFYEETKLSRESGIILSCFEYYFEVQKLIRKEYLFKTSKKNNLQQDRKVIDEAIAFCFKMYSKNQEELYAIKALEFIENEKSILLYESLAKNSNSIQNEDYLMYLSEKKNLIDNLVAAQLNNDTTNIRSIKDDIKSLDFENEIKSKNLTVNKLDLESFNIQEFKDDFLQKEEALVVFYDANDLFSIVISKDKTSFHKIIKDKEFVEEIKAFANSFSFKNRFKFKNKIAQSLGLEIKELLPLGTKKIYLATDGILNNIPFEAFKVDNKYFLENYEFQYIFSANILQNIKYQKTNNHQILAIAPIFENNSKKKLIKSEEEVKNVLKQIKGKSFLKEKATTTNFLKQAKEFAILHISSHAQIDKKLQVASIDFYDKSLFFSQIEQEEFETELLVLSACETGVGEQEAGEGTLSLSKAFAYTKIPSIISSLWKVNEESSLIIFDSFYKNIQTKNAISLALRNAKIDYLNNQDISEEKKQPYYWASFILLGEDNILEIQTVKNNSNIFYLVLAIFAFISIWITYKYVKNHF